MSSWAEAKWISDNIISHIDQKAMTIQPNNMRKFEIRNISDTSAGLTFLEPEDILSGGHVICKTKGVMIRMSTVDYPKTIDDGSLVLVNTDLGKYSQNEYVVNNLSNEAIYYFTAFPFSTDNAYNMSQSGSNRVKTNTTPIYGIERDITSSSPYWTRTHFAKSLSATASDGYIPGHSDFDNIYPWSEMKRTKMGSNTMVKIPKFYYRRYRDGYLEKTEHIEICPYYVPGFSKHPGSDRYIGAYVTSMGGTDNYKYAESDTIYQASKTGEIWDRLFINKEGKEWGYIDIATVSAIQMLFLVEFACNDSQRIIGKAIPRKDGNITLGICDNVPNLTGISNEQDGEKEVIYRGIEKIWGNDYTWVDGVKKYEYKWKVSLKQNSDTSGIGNETKLKYDIQFPYNEEYISQMGLDTNLPWVLLPEETKGSSSTYFCDTSKQFHSVAKNFNFSWGGEGLFSVAIIYEDSQNSTEWEHNCYSRMLYTPNG